jgi:hypothetical protein
MKRLILMVALVAVFAAVADSSADYFPVGIGYTWTYQDSNEVGIVTTLNEMVGTEIIDGYETWITVETSPEAVDTSFTQLRADGIYMIVEFMEEERRPVRIAPSDIDVGTSWTAADIDTSFNMSGADISIQIVVSMEAIGRETVVVPAGSFASCLKIAMESEFTYEITFGGMPFASGSGVQSRDTTWHAQFVGMIQSRGMEYEIDMMSGTIADSSKTASYLQGYNFTNISENSRKPAEMSIIAYPNPFNSSVSIDVPEKAEIAIFDINGRKIADFGVVENGSLRWQPATSVESGVYFVRANLDGNSLTQRVMFIK